jgi:pentapeptide MXKDX repeat protein
MKWQTKFIKRASLDGEVRKAPARAFVRHMFHEALVYPA